MPRLSYQLIDEKVAKSFGKKMMQWSKEIWSFDRSITGGGLRQTLNFLKDSTKTKNIWC